MMITSGSRILWCAIWIESHLSDKRTHTVNHRKGFKSFWIIAAAMLLALFVGGGLVVTYLLGSICEDTVMKKAVSPDSRWTAYYFQRNCGQATPVTHYVGILPSSQRFKASVKNIVLAISEIDTVNMQWQGNSRLLIAIPYGKIHSQKDKFEEVEIVYGAP